MLKDAIQRWVARQLVKSTKHVSSIWSKRISSKSCRMEESIATKATNWPQMRCHCRWAQSLAKLQTTVRWLTVFGRQIAEWFTAGVCTAMSYRHSYWVLLIIETESEIRYRFGFKSVAVRTERTLFCRAFRFETTNQWNTCETIDSTLNNYWEDKSQLRLFSANRCWRRRSWATSCCSWAQMVGSVASVGPQQPQ